jgi:hypothetical protein
MDNTIIPFPMDFLNFPDNATVIPNNDVTINIFVNSNQPIMLSTILMNKLNKLIQKDIKKTNKEKTKNLKKFIKQMKKDQKKQIIIDI